MPEICCTIAVTPLVRELVLYFAEQEHTYSPDSKTARLAAVLLEHIPDVPVEALHLPVSDHPKIRIMAEALFNEPDDRRTLKQWAAHLAISERSLAADKRGDRNELWPLASAAAFDDCTKPSV